MPALGTLPPLPRRTRRIRMLLLLLVVLALAVGRLEMGQSGQQGSFALPGAVRVAPSFYRGGPPSDSDLAALRDDSNVRAVIRVGQPDIAEKAATGGLGQAYLEIQVPPGAAPTLVQLTTIAGFLRGHLARPGVVYLHGDTGEQAVTTAAQLELLRGETLPQVLDGLSAADVRAMSSGQLVAVRSLAAALTGDRSSTTANSYASARPLSW